MSCITNLPNFICIFIFKSFSSSNFCKVVRMRIWSPNNISRLCRIYFLFWFRCEVNIISSNNTIPPIPNLTFTAYQNMAVFIIRYRLISTSVSRQIIICRILNTPRWRKRPRLCLSTKSAVKKFKEF